MPNKKYVGTGLITPLVMEVNEETSLQNPHISHNKERPGLHASSFVLAESIDSLSCVHSQASASHSSWIDTERTVSGEESSSHATSADSYSYRFQCQTIHSAPNCQFLGMKNCQVPTPQEQISGDTKTVHTGSVGHQGCSDFGGMQNLEFQSHDDTQSAFYNQMMDQNSWINNTLEASSLQLGGLRINEPAADVPSNELLAVTNYFNRMNCMHQEMGNDSDVTITTTIVPVDNQTSGIQPVTQDLQGIYENYGNSSSHNVGKVQREQRFRHSVEPYQKLSKKARELLKKKQIQDQLDFVDNFHGLCPKLVYIPTFSSIQEDENLTPLSPTWPGK